MTVKAKKTRNPVEHIDSKAMRVVPKCPGCGETRALNIYSSRKVTENLATKYIICIKCQRNWKDLFPA